MKKYMILAAAALVALAACKKTDEQVPTQEPAKDNTPAWVNDESAAVPIEFGVGQISADVKGIAMDATAFETAYFDVLAVNQASAVMPGFEGGVFAQNVKRTEAPLYNVAKFKNANNENVDKFYPYLLSAGYFKFYGYHVGITPAVLYADADEYNEANQTTLTDEQFAALSVAERTKTPAVYGTHQTLTASNTIANVPIGQNDIIWAKAEPTQANLYALGLIDADTPEAAATYPGFNAKYVRAARTTAGDNLTTYYDYLPKLAFNHLTSQIQFVIKAADATAQTTLANAAVAISSIEVGGTNDNVTGTTTIHNQATFDVVAGTLTGSNLGTIGVLNIPTNFTITTAGANCGEPIFILPINGDILMTLNITLPGMEEPQVITSKLRAPAVVGTGTNENPQYAAGTFAAGLAYQYTIILHSIEKIEVVTTLAEWIPGGNSDITLE